MTLRVVFFWFFFNFYEIMLMALAAPVSNKSVPSLSPTFPSLVDKLGKLVGRVDVEVLGEERVVRHPLDDLLHQGPGQEESGREVRVTDAWI